MDFGADSFQDLGLRPDRCRFGMFGHWGVCAWLKGKYTIFSKVGGDFQLYESPGQKKVIDDGTRKV